MTLKPIPEAKRELEQQIKLHINERLLEKGLITEEMYKKAKHIYSVQRR